MTSRKLLISAVLILIVHSPGVFAEEGRLLQAWDFADGAQGWSLMAGDSLAHIANDGDKTPNGSLETLGADDNGYSGISSECIDLTDVSDLFRFRLDVSVKLTGTESDSRYVRWQVLYFREAACMGGTGGLASDILASTQWQSEVRSRVPHQLVKSIKVRLYRQDTPEGGGVRFDDIAIYESSKVRQIWVIGVGEIADNVVTVDELVYTRGGAFGAAFVPAEVAREPFGALELVFSGCDSADMTFAKGFYTGGFQDLEYPIIRLAANRSGSKCTEQGFENMPADDNGWMAGYWWGGPDRDGEGFVIDVLEDGVTAVVTWYSYHALD